MGEKEKLAQAVRTKGHNFRVVKLDDPKTLYWGTDIRIADNDKTVLRAIKITLKPNVKQQKILKSWFHIYRYFYNRAITYINSQYKKNGKCAKSISEFRKKVRDTAPDEMKSRIKKSKVPVHTVDNALRDAIKAYKTCLANLKAGNIKFFRLRKKRSTGNQNICIESSAFSKKYNSFAVRALGKSMRSSQSIKDIPKKRDSRLKYSHGKYTLYVPTDKGGCQTITDRMEVCSLDPGARTFQTLYDTDQHAEYGSGSLISGYIKKIEEKKKFQHTKWYKKYSRRLYDKIRNIVDDLHWKTAKSLCQQYDLILIGNLSTKRVGQTGLNKKTKTVLSYLRHYEFRLRLMAKAEEFDTIVKEVDESYTSKTCGRCGNTVENLGGSKIFRCPCGFEIDRDFNGSRNIMIKYYA